MRNRCGANPVAGEVVSSYILGMRVDATSYDDAVQRILAWARAGQSRYVCVANVHMVMESYDDPAFRQVVNQADLVTPDGMPLVWTMRRLGLPGQERVCGPHLMARVLEGAARRAIPVGFYGSTSETLERLTLNLRRRYPGLQIGCRHSPPFRPLTPQEDRELVAEIRRSGVQLLFVALGCPKQEHWMAKHRGRLPVVMLGVGAAFDFLAGTKPRAPRFLQELGLEWLFRLLTEPRRLWRRNLYHNPRFLALLAAELLKGGETGSPRTRTPVESGREEG